MDQELLNKLESNRDFYEEEEHFEIVPVVGYVKGFKRRDGILFSGLVNNLSVSKEINVRDDDTFVIGIPKSGTTWIEEIVWLLKHDLDFEQAKNVNHSNRVVFIDGGLNNNFLETFSSPRVFKSHLPFKFLPDNINKKAKIVYVIRNPKDVIVSLYHFSKSLKIDKFEGTLQDIVDLFVQGNTAYGPWWNHVDEYTQQSGVHIIHYEDLIQEPLKIVKNLANYLNVQLNDSQLKMLIEFVAFDNMKNYPAFDYTTLDKYFTNNIQFFRKGKVGNWKNYFTHEMNDQVDQVISKYLTYKGRLEYESK